MRNHPILPCNHTLVFLFVVLLSLSIASLSAAEVVEIPDDGLRSVIEDTLGKNAGAPITQAEMETLTELDADGVLFRIRISDLTSLQFATNLTWLGLDHNNISDLSPLAGLTNLTELCLYHNNISDLSPLTGLTELTELVLDHNNISDLSPLTGLTNLTTLAIVGNNISDISPLAGLTDLTELNLLGNPLNTMAFETHIPAHQSRGASVHFDAPTELTHEADIGLVGKADVNADGGVNILDLVRVANAFGEQANANPKADVNGDGVINILDLVLVASFFE